MTDIHQDVVSHYHSSVTIFTSGLRQQTIRFGLMSFVCDCDNEEDSEDPTSIQWPTEELAGSAAIERLQHLDAVFAELVGECGDCESDEPRAHSTDAAPDSDVLGTF